MNAAREMSHFTEFIQITLQVSFFVPLVVIAPMVVIDLRHVVPMDPYEGKGILQKPFRLLAAYLRTNVFRGRVSARVIYNTNFANF